MDATVQLKCLDAKAAAAVVAEWSSCGGADNTVQQAGDRVRISYFDKRYPLDVAEWAFENDHAHDADAARVIGSL